MSTISSHIGQGNAADITVNNLNLASAPEFDVIIPPQVGGQFIVVDSCLYVNLPANHGGLRLNWRVPLSLSTQAWPLAKVRDDWTIYGVGDDTPGMRVVPPGVNDPQHTDAAVINPGAIGQALRIRASHLFRSPAAGATISLQAAKVAAGASPVVLAFSHIEIRMFT